ncbi:MAG: hypothetical protein LUE99_05175 [Bacteroides sp.]|nr:hypothetical protein [Bacteroides sp.]
MKKAIFIVMILSLISCTPILEKKYDETLQEEDLVEVAKQISPEELQLLKEYILEKNEKGDVYLKIYTYQELLNMAKYAKIAEEKHRQAEEEKQKIIKENTELLCNKKWKTIQHEFIVPDYADESSDSAYVFSVNEKVLTAMADARRKIYSSDGTYKTLLRNKESSTGTWEFTDTDRIVETRPEESPSLYSNVRIRGMKEPTYILDIIQLDKDALSYTEKQVSTYAPTHNMVTYIVMVAN